MPDGGCGDEAVQNIEPNTCHLGFRIEFTPDFQNRGIDGQASIASRRLPGTIKWIALRISPTVMQET